MTGVLLFAKFAEGVPYGKYFCEVSHGNRTEVADTTPKSNGSLSLIYPAEFADAPALPLPNDEYSTEWYEAAGVGRRSLARARFWIDGPAFRWESP